jgi:hypothetical protein
MKKLILWFKSLFQKRVTTIDMPKIQILSTGTVPVTQEALDKYLDEERACIAKRVEEYPSWESIVEAMIDAEDGNTQKLNAIIRKRKLVKQKYPKPTIRG